MSNFYAYYPPVGGTGNPSVGPTGTTAPTDATEIGGVDGSGNLIPVAVDSSGVVQVNISGTSPTPLPVTDAAVETNTGVIAQAIGTSGSAVPVSTAVVAGSDGTNARTLSTDMTGKLNVNATLTSAVVSIAGKTKANTPVRNDYSSVNVTTTAYVQLVASTTLATTLIEIFDSSGQTLYLATGGSGSEVNQLIIYPGGNGQIPFAIPAGSRVSIKAISATASVGEIDINFYA